MSGIDTYKVHGGTGGLDGANRTSREMATWELLRYQWTQCCVSKKTSSMTAPAT